MSYGNYMINKFTYLKRIPSVISKSSEYSIQDYSATFTVSKNNSAFTDAMNPIMLNDIIVLCSFEDNRTDSDDISIVDQVVKRHDQWGFDRISKQSFFGFINIAAFQYYCLLLYVIYKEHPEPNIKSMVYDEMEMLNEVFIVQDMYNSGSKVYGIKDALLNNIFDVDYDIYETLKVFITDTSGFRINSVASRTFTRFRDKFDNIKGKGHVFLKYYGATSVARGTNTNRAQWQNSPNRKQRMCTVISAFKLFKFSVGNSSNFNFCLQDPSKNDDIITKIMLTGDIAEFTLRTMSYRSFEFERIGILKKDKQKGVFDVSESHLRECYSSFSRNVIGPEDVTLQYVGDINEYEYYRDAINKKCKSLDIVPKLINKVIDEPKYRFSMKIDYTPKNVHTLIKILSYIGTVDSNAIVSNTSHYSMYTFDWKYTDMTDRELRRLVSERTRISQKEYTRYKEFINTYFRNGVSYAGLKKSKIVEIITSGFFDPYDPMLRRLCEYNFGSRKLTITVRGSDIKRLNRIKLYGANIREISYHMTDRKEVLEYFNNY